MNVQGCRQAAGLSVSVLGIVAAVLVVLGIVGMHGLSTSHAGMPGMAAEHVAAASHTAQHSYTAIGERSCPTPPGCPGADAGVMCVPAPPSADAGPLAVPCAHPAAQAPTVLAGAFSYRGPPPQTPSPHQLSISRT